MWHTIITDSLINNLSIINMLYLGVCPQTMCSKYKLKWNIWLIDYLLLNSQRQIYPNGRKDFPVLSSFMTYHWLCIYNNTMGATSGAGTAYPSGAPEFTLWFSGVHVTQSLVFSVVFCRSLFVLLSFFLWRLYCFSFSITDSDYTFGIFLLSCIL